MATPKQQLIDGIVMLIEEFEPNKVTERERVFFEQQTIAWLNDMHRQLLAQASDKRKDRKAQELLDRVRAAAREQYLNDPEVIRKQQEEAAKAESQYRAYHLFQIFNAVIAGKRAVRNAASEAIIIGWLNPGESLSVDWFLGVLSENPKLAEQIPWRSASADPKAEDYGVFKEAAKVFKYAANQANFGLIQSALGQGFTQGGIEAAIKSGSLCLAPATQPELDQWHQQSIEENNQRILNLNPYALLIEARQESANQRAQQEQQQVNEAFEASKQRDEVLSFPSLPAEITKEIIRSAPSERLKFWIKRYGNANVTARLQGRG